MGRLVADAGNHDGDELTAECGVMLMEVLAVMGSRGKHVNARRVQHLMGYLKNHVSSEDKQELLGLIEDYRLGMVPLIVPLTLLKDHLNRYPVPDWVAGTRQQVYLHPYPKELMLRNTYRPALESAEQSSYVNEESLSMSYQLRGDRLDVLLHPL